MKYCSKCGKELFDEAVVCVNCGCAVETIRNKNIKVEPSMTNSHIKYCAKCGKELLADAVICTNCGCAVAPIKRKKDKSGLITAVKVLMIIGTVFNGLNLIPLAWCIPMTVSYFKKINNGEEISTRFKVCTLLFVSMIAGIIMLCDNDH